MTAPYSLIKPPRGSRPCRAYPKREAPEGCGPVHWIRSPSRTRLACIGSTKKRPFSYAGTHDPDLVTCTLCITQIAGRVEGALCRVEAALSPPSPLDLQARYMGLRRRPGETDADLRHRLETIALNP